MTAGANMTTLSQIFIRRTIKLIKGTIYCLWLGLIAVWLTIPMNSHADAILSVRGTVTGADGAFVDGLEITVTNSTKNLSQTGVTSESGTGVYSVLFYRLLWECCGYWR